MPELMTLKEYMFGCATLVVINFYASRYFSKSDSLKMAIGWVVVFIALCITVVVKA